MKRRQRMAYMCNVILGAMKRRGGDQIAYIRNSVQVLREFKVQNSNNTRAGVLYFFASEVRVCGVCVERVFVVHACDEVV